MIIDVLISTAAKGGVENIIKMMIEDLEGPNMHFRVVQLVWEGEKWLSERVPFYPLLEGKGDYSLDTFTTAYRDFLCDQGIPDIILATVWPYTISVAKDALTGIGPMQNRIKVISWMHHDIDEYKRNYDYTEEWLSRADGHFAINGSNHKKLKELFPDKPTYRLRNPISIPSIIPHKSCAGEISGSLRKGLRLAFVGRVSEEKNVEFLLNAVSKVKDCELYIIGSYEDKKYYDDLKQLSEEINVSDRVFWLGWQQDPWSCVINNDIEAVCLTSLYEGFPLAALESLAHGIPVIASRTTGIKEIIEYGVNGYTFDIGDERKLLNILINLSEKGVTIRPEDCYETALIYERHTVFWDMSIKLVTMALGEELVPDIYDHPWFADEKLVKDKISVIIPCHNAEKYIGECLDSLLRQSLRVAELEIICVDDASTDNTLNILKEYEQANEDKIMLIPLSENVRAGAARNIGLSYAAGNYIAFVDADDIVSADMLDRLYRNIIKYDTDVIGCDFERFEKSKDLSFAVFDGEDSIISYDFSDTDVRRRYIVEKGSTTAVWGKLYARSFLEDNNIAFPEGLYLEDIYFTELVMMSMNKYVYISEKLYGYRINPEGTMFSELLNDHYMDPVELQCMASREILKRDLGLETCLSEFEILHFNIAFMGIMKKMKDNNKLYSYSNYCRMVKELFDIFPDFRNNPYLEQDAVRYYAGLLDINNDTDLRNALYEE